MTRASWLTLMTRGSHTYHCQVILANTWQSLNAVSMLGQRRRRRANIETALGEDDGPPLKQQWLNVPCFAGDVMTAC